MRNPYIVGGPVMGRDFYGRESIIETICERRDRAVHVMGMRRIGKTSLLRQLESQLSGIFLNFQAAVRRAELTRQVQRELRRLSRRLPWLPFPDEGKSAFELLEDADERAEAEGVSLWLLCDEAEGLIDLGEQDSEALKMLRGVLWGGRAIRTVLASAKNLVKLDDLCREWHTSPFLSNFPPPLYLGGLADEAADALITQSQSESPVKAAPELYAEIRRLTNNHPYLIQWLCHRLWQPDNTLRPITPRDLEPNEHLAARLRMDFDYLSGTERRIMHVMSAAEGITEPQLHGHISHPRLSTFLHGLTQLGYLRKEGEVYAVGNRFLASWLEMAPWEESSKVSDESTHAVYEQSRLEQVLVLVQEDRLSLAEIQRTLDAIRRAMIAWQRHGLPADVGTRRNLEKIEAALASRGGPKHKLEATLPFLFPFLVYKMEWGGEIVDHLDKVHTILDELEVAFGEEPDDP